MFLWWLGGLLANAAGGACQFGPDGLLPGNGKLQGDASRGFQGRAVLSVALFLEGGQGLFQVNRAIIKRAARDGAVQRRTAGFERDQVVD